MEGRTDIPLCLRLRMGMCPRFPILTLLAVSPDHSQSMYIKFMRSTSSYQSSEMATKHRSFALGYEAVGHSIQLLLSRLSKPNTPPSLDYSY